DADAFDFTEKVVSGLSMPGITVVDVDCPLGYAGAVQGTVRDSQGNLLDGALVQAALSGGATKGPWQTVTVLGGTYVLEDLDAPATYDLLADHSSSAVASVQGLQVPAPS